MLDRLKVRAITLDLDDTLWPIWPTIARAERQLQDWLRARAAATVAPTERRARSAMAGLHGKPISRCSAGSKLPVATPWM